MRSDSLLSLFSGSSLVLVKILLCYILLLDIIITCNLILVDLAIYSLVPYLIAYYTCNFITYDPLGGLEVNTRPFDPLDLSPQLVGIVGTLLRAGPARILLPHLLTI